MKNSRLAFAMAVSFFPGLALAGPLPAAAPFASVQTYTPTVAYVTPGNLSVTYTTETGQYVTANGVTVAKFQVTFTPTYTTASGNFSMSLPPGTTLTGSNQYAGCTLAYGSLTGAGFPTSGTMIFASVVPGPMINFISAKTAALFTTYTAGNMVSGTAYTFNGSCTYF